LAFRTLLEIVLSRNATESLAIFEAFKRCAERVVDLKRGPTQVDSNLLSLLGHEGLWPRAEIEVDRGK